MYIIYIEVCHKSELDVEILSKFFYKNLNLNYKITFFNDFAEHLTK